MHLRFAQPEIDAKSGSPVSSAYASEGCVVQDPTAAFLIRPFGPPSPRGKGLEGSDFLPSPGGKGDRVAVDEERRAPQVRTVLKSTLSPTGPRPRLSPRNGTLYKNQLPHSSSGPSGHLPPGGRDWRDAIVGRDFEGCALYLPLFGEFGVTAGGVYGLADC